MDSEYPESDMNGKKTLPDRIKFEYSQKNISIPERALFGTSSHKAQEKFSLVEDFDDKIPPGDTGADP